MKNCSHSAGCQYRTLSNSGSGAGCNYTAYCKYQLPNSDGGTWQIDTIPIPNCSNCEVVKLCNEILEEVKKTKSEVGE